MIDKTDSIDYAKGRGIDSRGNPKRDGFLFNWEWDSSNRRCSSTQVGDFVLEVRRYISTISSSPEYRSNIYYLDRTSYDKLMNLRTTTGVPTRIEAQKRTEHTLKQILERAKTALEVYTKTQELKT